jgi:hypothetical protein
MMVRWTESDINAARKRVLNISNPNRKPIPKHSKYRNHPTYVDNKRFASQKEASYYTQLKLAKAMDQIRGFACQVSIPLPSGKRRMVIDFMVIELDGRVRWVDTKGFATDTWKTKRDELEHSLGIQIETV